LIVRRQIFCRYDGFSFVFAHCEVEDLAATNVLPGFGFTLGTAVRWNAKRSNKRKRTTANALGRDFFHQVGLSGTGPLG
jgi:hypothetical protein